MILKLSRKSRISAAATALVLVAGIAHAGHKLERVDQRTIDVAGQRMVVIINTRGTTIVVGEKKAKKVSIVANKWVKASDEETAAKIMDALDIDVEVSKEKIAVKSNLPEETSRESDFWSVVRGGKHKAYIDLTVEVPYDFDVETSTTSGNVQVTNIGGAARVNATSGDILLREIGGPSVIELTSGNIQADDLRGDIQIQASSGNAEIRRVKGQVAVEATSGNVDAYEVGGDAVVNLVSGNLLLKGCLGNVQFSGSRGNAEILGLLGGVNATSSSGDLDVVIVPVGDKEFYLNTSSGNVVLHYITMDDYGFELDVNTCTGAIRGDLDLKKLDRISRRKLKGVVGNGRSRVIIETASGDVSIVERTQKIEPQ